MRYLSYFCFAFMLLLVGFSVVVGLEVSKIEWIALAALGTNSVRAWLAEAKRKAQAEEIWGENARRPTYHTR